MFTLSVLLMAIPTLLIGCLPAYRSAGLAAPLLLLALRIMQGIAIGGEAPGGWVFVAEHARPQRVGIAVGLLTSGLSFGILLGSLITLGLNLKFSQAEIAHGYWRIPFVIGGVFGFIAMFLRQWLDETPVFEEIRMRATASRELPLRVALRNHRQAVVASLISTWVLTAANSGRHFDDTSAVAETVRTGASGDRDGEPCRYGSTLPLDRDDRCGV
jgi:MFS family permease